MDNPGEKLHKLRAVQTPLLERDKEPTLQGEVDTRTICFVLDSNALITVVPQELVRQNEDSGEITLMLVGGTLRYAKTTKVELSVGPYKGKRTVAMLPGKALDNKVLFSSPSFSFQLNCQLNSQLERKKEAVKLQAVNQSYGLRRAYWNC